MSPRKLLLSSEMKFNMVTKTVVFYVHVTYSVFDQNRARMPPLVLLKETQEKKA